MIERTMERHILEWAKKLPVIAILGPRQSDKNDTFKKKLFVIIDHYRHNLTQSLIECSFSFIFAIR